MSSTWTTEQLQLIDVAQELRIATTREDATLRREVPIWVVSVEGQVYVRTWYRRDSGWFAHAVRTQRALVRVPGLEADVTVEDVGRHDELRTDVDAAYRAKYGRFGASAVDRMVTDDAAATTLRLSP